MDKVPDPPSLPKPPASANAKSIISWMSDLSRSLWRYFLDVSRRLNAVQTLDEVGALSSVAGTPKFRGQLAFSGGNAYIAVGTTSSADWKQIT